MGGIRTAGEKPGRAVGPGTLETRPEPVKLLERAAGPRNHLGTRGNPDGPDPPAGKRPGASQPPEKAGNVWRKSVLCRPTPTESGDPGG